MPRWPNWVRRSNGPRRPWTCGSPGWAGAVKKTRHAAEQPRPDVARQRARWHKELQTEPAARLVCAVPHGHYQTTTLIAAVRLKGPQAPWLFGGAVDGELFLAWVKQGLVLGLQPDDVVGMDKSGHAQGGGRAGGHRRSRGAAGIPAAVFAGLQPD